MAINKLSGVEWDAIAAVGGTAKANIAAIGGPEAPAGTTQASRWMIAGHAGKICSTDTADASEGWSEIVDLGNMDLMNVAIGHDNSGNKRWVLQGNAGYLAEIWYANNSLDLTDSNNWSSVTHTNNNIAADGGGPGVAWGNDVWIAGGKPYNDGDSYLTMMRSTDGAGSWSAIDEGNTVNDQTRVVCYKSGDIWAMGHQSHVWVSTNNGVAWTDKVTLEGTKDVEGMAYDGSSLWVAVLQSGNIYTSDDDWDSATERSSATGTSHNWGVVYAGGNINKWVISSSSGKISYSSDGISWTAATSGTTDHLYGIATDDTTIVIVGSSGTILTSPDGINWTSRTSNVSVTLRNVACDIIGAGMR
tara:strand:- start:396 stop:1475 length:1080 start_codon:yes stop_codon:yes gene_type:complete